ncbi:SGNH/GDSL hydrolase family protein [Marinicella sp. W31]|uniref:SGNH/GDSL hydrolase family protein n=1 Tax=Marinicella sp. W31 TaxID=3023713 RepID=UPI003757B2DC
MRFAIAALLTLPLLPVMYFQARKIRATVPKLPEAQEPQGVSGKTHRQRLRLLLLGESTMAGVGVDKHSEGFAGILADSLSHHLEIAVHWQVNANSGYTAEDVRSKTVPNLDAEADLIVIGLGANDAFKLNTPKRWRRHIAALIHSLRKHYPQTPIVFTNMPPIKEFPAMTGLLKLTIGNLVEALGRALAQEITAHDHVYYHARTITVKDWIERFQVDKHIDDFFSDGIHPSQLTYRIWAQDLAQFIQARPETMSTLDNYQASTDV